MKRPMPRLSVAQPAVVLRRVADALGLEGHRVSSIDLHLGRDKLITADVTFIVDDDRSEAVAAAIEASARPHAPDPEAS